MTAARTTTLGLRSTAEAARPRVLPSSVGDWTVLDAEDRALLARLHEESLEFVSHDLFEKPDAEAFLFGQVDELTASSTCFQDDGRLRIGTNNGDGHLTAAQEILLFQRYNFARMKIASFIQQSGTVDDAISFEGARYLLAWAHRAEAIRAQIVQANMPLVLAMGKRTRLSGLDPNEMISEGNLALLRSVNKFDCSRGFKFSTYACRAILKSFSRVAMRTARYRGHFPTEFDPSLEKGDFTDRMRDDLEARCVDEIREILSENRASLSDVEQMVIRERFALDALTAPAKGRTLEQVGTMIGVTKERVRQIQNKALAKLRAVLEESYLDT
jgi:RNA polymerase primary sigma factor